MFKDRGRRLERSMKRIVNEQLRKNEEISLYLYSQEDRISDMRCDPP